MDVDYITEVGPRRQVQMIFSPLPPKTLNTPKLNVGMLIGQNAAALLPTGGEGYDGVGNIHLMKIPFGMGPVLSG
jgi:hypothetical protein